jgi:hypothetical protein
MQRLLNFALIGIVGLSLLAQTIRFGLELSGAGSGFWSGLAESLAMAIFPATAIAVIKCLLHVMRGVRGDGGLALAGTYGLVALWPLVLGGMVMMNAADSMTVPNPRGGLPELMTPVEVPNESFLDGKAWAAVHKPTKRTGCKGNPEFVRGCAEWIRDDRTAQARAGLEWGQLQRPERASQCQGTPDFIRGCRTWYYQQPASARLQGPGPFGTSTRQECIGEVNANYEAKRDLNLLDGMDKAPESNRRRQWLPDLQACERLEPVR